MPPWRRQGSSGRMACQTHPGGLLSCNEGSELGLTAGHQVFLSPSVSRVHPGVAARASGSVGASRAPWPPRQSSEWEWERSACVTGKPKHQRTTVGTVPASAHACAHLEGSPSRRRLPPRPWECALQRVRLGARHSPATNTQ